VSKDTRDVRAKEVDPRNKGETFWDIASEAATEACRAAKKFPSFNSSHEGYAIILEELDELWDEVKNPGGNTSPHYAEELMDRQRKEAIQVAAMAIRFVYDLKTEKLR